MKRHTKLLAGVLALSLLGAACGGDDDGDDASSDDASSDTTAADIPDGPAITVGAQDFGESLILSEIYAGGLDVRGYEADTTEVGGFRDLLLSAFDSGEINFAVDYVASQLEFLNEGAGEATSDVDETLAPRPRPSTPTPTSSPRRRPTTWTSPRCPTWPRRAPTSRWGRRPTASRTASASPASTASTGSTSRRTSRRSTSA